jgi:hypothetical protein
MDEVGNAVLHGQRRHSGSAADRKLVVNFTSATEMTRDFGISSASAALCKQGRPYASMAAFAKWMLSQGATKAQVAAFVTRGAVLNGP